MGTSSLMRIVRKRKNLLAFSMLSGLLLALQLLLPSAAFAQSAAAPGYVFGTSGKALDKASVSVVRLVATYSSTDGSQTKQCTGLGVLVSSSSPSGATGSITVTNWVVTDGTLLVPTMPPCLAGSSSAPPGRSVAQFTSETVAIYASTAYTAAAGSPSTSLIQTLAPVTQATSRCQKTCGSGLTLFSFSTSSLQPFLDTPSIGSLTDPQQIGVALTDGTATIPSSKVETPSANPTVAPNPNPIVTANPATSGALPDPTHVLTPVPVQTPMSSSTQEEVGMPIVDSNGDLVGMRLASGPSSLNADTITFVTSSITTSARAANALHTHWNEGVTDFYATPPRYPDAQKAFQQIATESRSPNFRADSAFTTVIAPKLPSPHPSNSPNPSTITIFGIPKDWLVIGGIVIALLVLIGIFLLVSFFFGGRARSQDRAERARFNADRRRAESEVRQWKQPGSVVPTVSNRAVPLSQPPALPTTPELHCPHCSHAVSPNDNFCPNCRYMLSPSASGLHLKATLPPPPPPQGAAPEPPAQMSPAPVPPPWNGYAAPANMAPASSISDMPTLDMEPAYGSIDETAQLPPVQRDGRNLSFVVGYRSDVGLKRKHKPNEDNLLAVQGARAHHTQPQQFGLFVVADGMGGHANGQDASRLAIQTIMNYLLPKISTTELENDSTLQSLLVAGVQASNQAVYQHNMDTHADTGTTMTAAMVVGATAYVANVGDSRTYLYREPDGLSKITHDHSIVASLVDAGIIQPDDVYTHPKRNQIYRSLGEKSLVEVDPFTVPLKPGDKLLLCSDGLWEMVRDPDIARLLSAPMPDPTNALIQAALEGGGEDNVSVIVVNITGAANAPMMTGIQLLAKPDAVTVPDMPPM